MKIKLVVNYRVPSLNKLFKMNHFARFKERRKAHHELLSALDRADRSCSIPTTYAQRVLSTACVTLALYLTTARKTSSSSSPKRSAPKKRIELRSK